ncbi:CoA transferase [Corynebacterium lizhenjunii]|uniref:CoA transferase n=1 Tax=Corynebacterium lizhenjunii TaxID=2709394 RepID=A0A7T0KEU4_9CORY|nr:CaiB/BaiF CoA-transferase family protein [Corynebacterium lizhenjunii]QPK79490.1 CoA transferase [Corynebacterium lizhenjunii]
MQTPLQDVRVVFLGGIGPGPFAAMVLADMGAHVTRIIRPEGDSDIPHDILYRGQDTLVADLKSPEGRAQVLELLEHADALIEGFRPGVAERLGLGPADAHAANPALAYCRMTGWGQDGPLAHTAGHDINYIAVAGALEPIAGADGTPVPPINFMGDFGGGSMYLVAGLLGGLLQARSTGRGCVVDAAIVDGTAHLTAMLHSFRNAGQWGPRGSNLLDGGAPFYRVYQTADTRYMAVGAIEPQFYAQLLERLGLTEELGAYPQYAQKHWPVVRAAFARVFATRTQEQWARHFAGSDACVSEVVAPAEVLDHPHLAARGVYRLADPSVPGHYEPAPAPRFIPAAQAD